MKSIRLLSIALLACMATIDATSQTLTRSLMLRPLGSSFTTTINSYTTPSAMNWTLSFPDSGGLAARGPFLRVNTTAGAKTVSFSQVNLAANGPAADVTGILAVSNGGTGLSSVTAGAMLVGNGTSALQTVAGGTTTGQILTWNAGTGLPVWTTSIGGGGQTLNISNSGSGNTTNINNSSTGGTTNIGNATSTTNFYGTSTFNTMPNIPLTQYNMYVGGASNYATELSTVANRVLLSPGGVPTWTQLVPIANGGTNSSATPTNGQVAYGDGTKYNFTTGGSTGQVLSYNSGGAPTWISVSTLISTLANQYTVTSTDATNGFATITPGIAGYSITSKIIVTYQTATGPAQAFTVSNQTATTFDVYAGAMNTGDKINFIIVP